MTTAINGLHCTVTAIAATSIGKFSPNFHTHGAILIAIAARTNDFLIAIALSIKNMIAFIEAIAIFVP